MAGNSGTAPGFGGVGVKAASEDPDVAISPARRADLAEILKVQKLAFRSEGELYGSDRIEPLVETHGQAESEFRAGVFLKATADGRIVGAVRALPMADGRSVWIGRLIVRPDFQNRGLGRRLMRAAENLFPERDRFETGHGQPEREEPAPVRRSRLPRVQTRPGTRCGRFLGLSREASRRALGFLLPPLGRPAAARR